jgi:hypothetical protein
MQNGPENMGNGAATDDRFAGQLGYRGNRREVGGVPADPGMPDHAPRNGAVPMVGSVMDAAPPTMPLGDLEEPVFPPPGWLDSPTGTLADHPLLRGLLLELPPKMAAPTPDWLDRWFEAARSILELLYVQSSVSAPRR